MFLRVPPVCFRLSQLLRAGSAVVVLFASAPALSETRYVTDDIEVGVHTDSRPDSAVIALVRSGTAVTVLESSGQFLRVRVDGGVEGWMDQHYLQSDRASAAPAVEATGSNEALEAELGALRAEVERLKSDLIDSEENRQRQIKSLSRESENEIQALRRELEAQRVLRAAGEAAGPPRAATQSLSDKVRELNAELARLRSQGESGGQLTSDALRQMERMAEESREAKVKLAQAESRARRLAKAALTQSAPAPAPPLLEQLNGWHWAIALSALVLVFGLGNLWAEFLVRRRHGGFRM
ncbi:MAG: TIGR04211 family SH3 domain-containing protein [Pseudomonadota bacterium]